MRTVLICTVGKSLKGNLASAKGRKFVELLSAAILTHVLRFIETNLATNLMLIIEDFEPQSSGF